MRRILSSKVRSRDYYSIEEAYSPKSDASSEAVRASAREKTFDGESSSLIKTLNTQCRRRAGTASKNARYIFSFQYHHDCKLQRSWRARAQLQEYYIKELYCRIIFITFFFSLQIRPRAGFSDLANAVVGDERFLPSANEPTLLASYSLVLLCVFFACDIIALIHFHCVLASKRKSPRKSYGTMLTDASSPRPEYTEYSLLSYFPSSKYALYVI